ncbi:hypothetical protein EAMBIBNC_00010 [Citrobacter phage BSwM KMM4]|nr:hypothetical protein [Shigella phage ESh22]WBF80925.1 hypothetical protein EAMBIBNC_00010 [Citrobacter phage BSwM KMM4]
MKLVTLVDYHTLGRFKMLLSGIAILISIVALYKAYQASDYADKAITRKVKINLVSSFLERLSVEQLQRLEMGFRFKADTYQISDVLSGNFELVNDYNALLNAIQATDLKEYYPVITQEINKRKK